jgi:hypothetical protein
MEVCQWLSINKSMKMTQKRPVRASLTWKRNMSVGRKARAAAPKAAKTQKAVMQGGLDHL